MVRKLSWLVALLALNCSMGAFALGLGDIDLHSALNQRINADIELLSVRPDDADSIKIILGSAEDFAQAGLERPYLLNQLRFLVVAKGKGHYRIHVTSEQAIREPFLDFLVQVTWRGGQLLREYTVLLDPPVLMPAPVQVITAPVTKAVAPATPAVAAPTAPATTPGSTPLSAAPQQAPTPPAPPKPAAQPSPSAAAPQSESNAPASHNGSEYGPIHPSETLWGIANRSRPNRSVSVDQMMQAILQANPDAFINNNVNNLKAGQILRIPSASEVDAVNAAKAHAATLTQNEAWRNRRSAPTAPAPVAAPAKAPAPVAEAAVPKAAPEPAAKKPPTSPATQKPPVIAPATPQTEAQLKVMAPPRENAAKSAGTATSTSATATASSRAATDIHKELAMATEAVEAQRQDTEDLRTRLTDLEQQISTMQKMMTIKDEQLASLQAKSAAAAVSPQTAGAFSNPATLAMIGIVAVVLAALLWIALRRRQLGVTGMQREIRVEPRPGPLPAPASSARVATAAVAAGAVTAAAVRAANKNVEPISPAPQLVVKPVAEQYPESDPLSEADIYLAYGRYQQAEDLIKEAMYHDRNPELRLKLLEIYYAAKNATGFEDAARDLRHDIGAGHELWQRVLVMGRELCPYSLLFGEDQSDAAAVAETGHAATTATPPDSYDTVVAPVKFSQESLNLDIGHGNDAADDTLDEVGTKLDLARAYIDMGDPEGARSILGEVLQEGSTVQQDEAQVLLQKLTH